jgi:hypothetical protein
MDELATEQDVWGLDQHLNGCLAGYQADPTYGAAVYFALEALSGIARDASIRANAGKLDADELDTEWIINPRTCLDVPWIWIRTLATAWERYKTGDSTLGHAFGLERGQGRPPIKQKVAQMLDERAIARWMGSRVQAEAGGKKIRIEDIVQEAAEKFGKSDVTIRRA